MATKDFSFVETPKHGKQHYELVYCILKCKIDTMKSQTEKAAYLECLSLNYKDLKDTKDIDEIYRVVSSLLGGVVGSYFLEFENLSKILILLCFIFSLLKMIPRLTRRFDFYQMIIKRLKDEIKCLS